MNSNFTMLPNVLFEKAIAKKIGPLGIALVGALLKKQATKKMGPSNRFLADMLGVTPNTVREGLRILHKAGLVRTVPRGQGRQNGFDLTKVREALTGANSAPVISQTGSDSAPNIDSTAVSSTIHADRLLNQCSIGGRVASAGEVLPAAPIAPTPIREAPTPKTRHKLVQNLHQSEAFMPFGDAPSLSDMRYAINAQFVWSGEESVWHKTMTDAFDRFDHNVIWNQLNWLPTRIVRAKTPIANIAGLFLTSIEKNYAPPSGKFVNQIEFDAWCSANNKNIAETVAEESVDAVESEDCPF